MFSFHSSLVSFIRSHSGASCRCGATWGGGGQIKLPINAHKGRNNESKLCVSLGLHTQHICSIVLLKERLKMVSRRLIKNQAGVVKMGKVGNINHGSVFDCTHMRGCVPLVPREQSWISIRDTLG